ncbi:MAG: hypothetical protein AAGK32_02690 [Actinomycetota bacterium]
MVASRPTWVRGLLVFVGAALLLAGTVTAYARDTLLDADEFADRGVAMLDDPEVRVEIAEQTVDALIGVEPDLTAARPLLVSATEFLIDSETVRSLTRNGLYELHAAVLGGDADGLVIRVADLLLVVNAQVRTLLPEINSVLPAETTDALVTILEGEEAADLIDGANRVRTVSLVLPVLAIVAFAAAVAVSPERRRTLVTIGVSVAAVGLVVMVGQRLGAAVLDEVTETSLGPAFWSSYLGDLRVWGLVVVAVGVITAAGAASVLRPIAVDELIGTVRSMVPAADTTAGQVVRVVGAGGLGAWLLFDPLGALATAGAIAGLVLLVAAVSEVVRRTTAPAGSDSLRSGFVRGGIAAAVGVGVLAVGSWALLSSVGDGADGARSLGCNGSVALCERPLDQVTVPATHNSMSAAEDGYLVANHVTGIAEQLDAGYRGLLIDTYYGLSTDDGVLTDVAPPTGADRELLLEEMGEEAVAAAEALRARQEGQGSERMTYLCHNLCELGANELVPELEEIRVWLEDNPREVLVVFIQDAISPADTEAAFEEAGLVPFLHEQELGEPFPTLGEMIDSGRRVFVMAEEEAGDVPWYHDGFAFTQETPYTYETVADFDCIPNRGEAASPLFQVNHWVTPAARRASAEANDPDLLLERLEQCRAERGLVPNIVGVDFAEEGDVLGAVREFNGLPRRG